MPRTATIGAATGDQGGMRPRLYLGLGLAFAGLGIAGCGTSSDLALAEVTGTVTYQNKPLERGTVVFIPEGATPGPQAVGQIEAGTYRMTTNGQSGAALGTHKVTVVSRAEQSDADFKALKIPKMVTPAKYAAEAKTPLTYEVKGESNEYNIELTD